MSFSTNMTPGDLMTAHEEQRRYDLFHARLWRDHYQAEVDRLEAMDPLKRVSTAGADFLDSQGPLGPEFEAVWDANVRTLYES